MSDEITKNNDEENTGVNGLLDMKYYSYLAYLVTLIYLGLFRIYCLFGGKKKVPHPVRRMRHLDGRGGSTHLR